MSYGQQLLKQYLDTFGLYNYKENYRPDWLKGMELDFYWDWVKVGIEFNGDQHYSYTQFGSPIPQQKRDAYKKQLCKDLGIKLLVLEAIDLQYMVLVGKLRRKGMKVPRLRVFLNKKSLLALNKKAIDYRKALIKSFGSFTARGRKSQIRHSARTEMHKKNKPIS